MAKTLTADAAPPAGSSASIPNASEEANFLSHIGKLRIQDNKVAIAKAALDAERAVLNDLFGEAKRDKFSRKELRAILDDGKAIRRDLVAEEERRAKLRIWAGLPAGAQPDLFGLGDTARDAVDADAHGYAMGRRGEDEFAPDWIGPNNLPDFSGGWRRAQAELLAQVGTADAPKAKGPKLVADNDAKADEPKTDAA
jgi:hypothetical protein